MDYENSATAQTIALDMISAKVTMETETIFANITTEQNALSSTSSKWI
jgi:hypothetical protein